MSSQAVQLPSRFPVGTRYVIEGRAGRIAVAIYLEFPDGRHVELPLERTVREPLAAGPARRGPARQENFEKKLTAAGTTFQVVSLITRRRVVCPPAPQPLTPSGE